MLIGRCEKLYAGDAMYALAGYGTEYSVRSHDLLPSLSKALKMAPRASQIRRPQQHISTVRCTSL